MRITKLTETFSIFRSQFQSTVKYILNKQILCTTHLRLLASLKIYLWPQGYMNSLRNEFISAEWYSTQINKDNKRTFHF